MSEIRTTELSEASKSQQEIRIGAREKISSFLKKTRNGIRRIFAASNEKSITSSFLESLYFSILHCKARVIATFLLTFSIASTAFCYISSSSLNHFISDENTFHTLCTFLISLILFTCSSSLHELISSSKILSRLSIVYDNGSSIFTFSSELPSLTVTSSTAFFIGIISAIFSVLYPVHSILAFYACLICLVLIFNRPECGLLITLLLVPLLNEFALFFFVITTFVSFLYRFLIGRRHMDFGIAEIMIILCTAYVCIRYILSPCADGIKTFLLYLVFFIGCIFTTNLIRTTVMFRRCFSTLIRMTRIYTLIVSLNIIGSLVFSPESVSAFNESLNIESVSSVLMSRSFVVPFLTIAIPLNFAATISSTKRQDYVYGIVYTFAMLLFTILLNSYGIILISLLSCVAVLFFIRKRSGLLALICPPATYLLYKISDLIISNRFFNVNNQVDTRVAEEFSTGVNIRCIFGEGFGEKAKLLSSTVSNIFAEIGIVGFLLTVITLFIILFKAFKALSSKVIKADKARTLSVGLICSILAFIVMCFFERMLLDFRCIYLFSVILSLSYTAVRCYEADFIDITINRDYM